jgi:Ulp1 family protease
MPKLACVLYFDSLSTNWHVGSGRARSCIDVDTNPIARALVDDLICYMVDSLARQYHFQVPNNEFFMQLIPSHVPQQMNGADCGLYVLHFIERLLRVRLSNQSAIDDYFARWAEQETQEQAAQSVKELRARMVSMIEQTTFA